MNKKIISGMALQDAEAFHSNYMTKEELANFLRGLPPKKVEELEVLIIKMNEGRRITVQPVKREAENGTYSYNVIEIKGKNGVMPFYLSYHPQIEKLIVDYLAGKIKIAFKLEDIYNSSI